MQLPQQLAPNGKWMLWDYQKRTVRPRIVADSNGVMTAELPQVPDNELWLLDRITVSSDSFQKTTLYLYENSVDPGNVLDGTLSGNFDVADMASPIQLQPTTLLLFQWITATTGATGWVRAQWTVLRPNADQLAA